MKILLICQTKFIRDKVAFDVLQHFQFNQLLILTITEWQDKKES